MAPMFHPDGPTFFELAEQALSSTERGYDLLAPKFDHTPFRTPDAILERVAARLGGPRSVERALDICCGTGAAMRVLRPLCREEIVGVDVSRGMLDEAERRLVDAPGDAALRLQRADALALPFSEEFELAVSFGAFGHILEEDEARFVQNVRRALRPGGRFAFVTGDRPSMLRPGYWMARGFNAAIRARNAVLDSALPHVLPDLPAAPRGKPLERRRFRGPGASRSLPTTLSPRRDGHRHPNVKELVQVDERGLCVRRGGFHIDPWAATDVAVVTHAHADHARPGMGVYHCAAPGAAIAQKRLGDEARIVAHGYGERFVLGDATVSLHPAGHVLGASQVRVEVDGEVWVVSGDFKRDRDPTTAPFEVVACDTFVSEATFALPIYRWPDPEEELRRLLGAWKDAARSGRPTVLFAYSLGKAQRLLSMLAAHGELPGPILTHGAVESITALYREAGVSLPDTTKAASLEKRKKSPGALVVAPPSAAGSPFMKRFGGATIAFASGWMRLRGPRRRRAVDLGLVISDHADWPALVATIRETGARRIRLTHGYAAPLARYLHEEGFDARALATRYVGEPEEEKLT